MKRERGEEKNEETRREREDAIIPRPRGEENALPRGSAGKRPRLA
jgi:hypothetical protein